MNIPQVMTSREGAASPVYRAPAHFRFLDLAAGTHANSPPHRTSSYHRSPWNPQHIYTFCSDDVFSGGFYRFYIAPHTPALFSRSLHWRLKFYALTLVSRRLRTEFRPIYLLATPAWLSHRYAFKYLSEFHGTATTVSANITIDLYDLFRSDLA
jgi:hypothetical protein